MSKRTWQFGRMVFGAGFVVALGLGARDAVAGVSPVQRRDPICESKCWNKYNVCQQYNLGDCEQQLDNCLANCAV